MSSIHKLDWSFSLSTAINSNEWRRYQADSFAITWTHSGLDTPCKYIHYSMWDEIDSHFQTSTAEPLKFGNG